MKKKNLAVQSTALAPIGADPIWDFLRKLPKKAAILGMKGHRSSGKESIEVYYSHCNRVVNTSFCLEGGAA